MKIISIFSISCMFLLLFSTNVLPQSNTKYISDDLTVFVHSGPSRNFRITGTFGSGQPVRLLNRSENGEFVEVRDDTGKQGWVETQYIQDNKSIRITLGELESSLESTQSVIPSLRAEISELSSTGQQQAQLIEQYEKTISSHETKIAELEEKLDTQKLDTQIRWLINGGALALFSIILGIVISYLPKKKKRNDGWIN